jgi:hypothetical protein
MTFGLRALILLSSGLSVASTPIISSTTSALPLTVDTIYQFPVPTWNENLAVRTNGQLLVTRLDTPLLMQVDPTQKLAPITIATFPSTYAGVLGITETSPDVFYVAAAAPFDSNFVKTSGNSSVFKIDMRSFAVSSTGQITTPATVTKVTDLPTAGFLNGMETLSATLGLVLIADSYNGVVYRLNVNTGAYAVVIDDPKMKYLPGAITNIGINGIKIRGLYLYWSNTGNPIFSRILINPLTGTGIGASQVVAPVTKSDDFVFRSDGTAWMCQNQLESLSVVENGQTTLVAGNPQSTILAGVTAGKFGRTPSTCNILYLTTNGGEFEFQSVIGRVAWLVLTFPVGLAIPVNGSIIVGGKVASIDTSSYS